MNAPTPFPAGIALVAMPGAGKSTVGKALSRQTGLPFSDSDQVIEKRLGMSIRAFFEQQGEAAFRDVEETVLAELALAPDRVLATGGGSVLRPANRALLKERFTVVYLRSTPEDLFRRLRHDRTRPLLQVQDPLQKLRELYRERDPLYRQTAHFVIETGRPSVQTLVNMILMQLELSGRLDPHRVPSEPTGRPQGPT